MAFDLNAFNQEYGHSSTGAGYNPSVAGGGVTTPKAPGFFSQVGHSIASAVPAVVNAVGHGIVDPFAHLIQNNINAANQGGNADSINSRRAALDAQSNSTLKDYFSGKLSKAQYNQQSKAQMQAYQNLQSEAQGNIDSVKSTAQMVPDAAQAIGTVATLGAGGLELGGAKATAEAVGAELAGSTGAKVAGRVVQGVSDTIGAGKGGGIVGLPGKIVRNAVVTQPTIQFGGQAAHDVQTGNLPAIGSDAALALAPAGISLLAKGAKAVVPAIADALHGTAATLTDAFGVNRVKQFMAENASNPNALNTLKQMQLFTEDQPAVKSGAISAGDFLKQHFSQALKVDPTTTPLNEVVAKFDTYAKNDGALQAWLKENPQAGNVVVSHDFTNTLPGIVDKLKGVEGADAPTRVDVVNKALEEAGIKNPSIRDKVGGMVLQGASSKDIVAELKQKHIISTPKGLLDKGYIATNGPKDVAHLPTIETAQAAGLPTVGSNPHGILGKVGTTLEKVGLGLKTTPSSVTQGAITDNLNKRLEGTDFAGKGKDIMGRLHEATSKTRGVFDPRLLRATTAGIIPGAVNIEHELGVSSSDAKMILKSVKGAYGDVPLGIRSAGEKLTDKTIQHLNIPGTGVGMASFLKAQGYGKFSLNPFFWAKQATKGEFIGQAETGGKALNVGRTLNQMLGTAPKATTMTALRDSGVFSKGNMAGGEADFLGNLAPELGAKVTGPEVSGYIQQSMGQAAEQFAKNNGTTVSDILKPGDDGASHPLKGGLDHLMQMVVGYPKGSNALNTNLAKSLNVLVFPSRFESKVAVAAAHYFTAQPKVVQLAMINGVLKANAWAGSPDGKQWSKDNADLMGIINYFSPTHSLDAVLSFGKSGQLADLGQIGGLPFGVITTILKNQGIALPGQLTGNNTNPATGENYVQKLPTSDKARVQQGLTDLIGQMFSYPGATVGLPSKTSEIQGLPGLKINAKDQKVVGGASGASTTKSTPSIPAIAKRQFTPFTGNANVAPVYKAGAKGKKPKTLAKLPGAF